MGLSKTEYEDAVNLEKLYFLANSHDQCAICGRGGVCSVDLQRYEFLCAGCSSGKSSAKKIGTDRFTAFEVQKMLNKFGGNSSSSTRDSGGGSSRSHRRSSSSARAPDRRRRHGRGHSRRRETPSSSSESPDMSDDSPPRATWAASRPRGSRAEKSSSRRKGGAPQEDFVSSGWPQPSSNLWTSAADTGAPQGCQQNALPGMGGLAGMGMAPAPHGQQPQQQPQQHQQQNASMWRQGQAPQSLMAPGLQQMQMPQQGGPLGSLIDPSQQWRAPGGVQPQQHMLQQPMMPQMQPIQQPNSSLFGMQQQPQPQPFGMGGALPNRSPQLMLQQQQHQNSMLQQHQQPSHLLQVQQLPPQQQPQQRNPFASMRGPQQPAARPSNPFASLQGSHFGGSPFQQQPLQQSQLQQPMQPPQQAMGMQQAYRPPAVQQQSTPFGTPVGAPLGSAVTSSNPFASMNQSKWASAHCRLRSIFPLP
ncbi:major ampullate spidroin 2, putative [Eimeria tenella]|uniref:Major ampullate spidroin 2, putative n=1 Tax=Eimeria tenella TaxID=5802 RepID=U6KK15_EIMTE|nr:major ampullate spidroin 2, putative [Eimeria tenella]CDJ37156.1 major ampullate spidroin 2, putative [Eimeria tenella]|eukprot:XP_013227994.1 major ampullate spidroin 2, putative [Eimeria tenella]